MKKLYIVLFLFLTGCVSTNPTTFVSQTMIKDSSDDRLNKQYRTLNVEKLLSKKDPIVILKEYINYLECKEIVKRPFDGIDCKISRKLDYKNISKVAKYLVASEKKIKDIKQKAYYYKKLSYLFDLINDNYQAIYYIKKSLKIDKKLCNKIKYSLNKKNYCLNLKLSYWITENQFPLMYDFEKIIKLTNSIDEKIFYSKKVISLINKFSPITKLKKIVKIDKKLSYKYLDKKDVYFKLLIKKNRMLYSLAYLYKEKKDYKKALSYLQEAYNLDFKIWKLLFYEDLHKKQKDSLTNSSLNDYKRVLMQSKLDYLLFKARIYSNYNKKKAIKLYLDYYKTWQEFIKLKKRNEILLVTTQYNEDINDYKKYKKFLKKQKKTKNKYSLYIVDFRFTNLKTPSQVDKKIKKLEQDKRNKIMEIEKKYSYLKYCNKDNLYYACVRDFNALLTYLEFFKIANIVNKDEYLVNLLKYIEKNELYYKDYDGFSINNRANLYYAFGEYFFESGNYDLAFDYLIKAYHYRTKYDDIFDGEYYYMLGVSTQKLGFYSDAFEFYEKSLKNMNKDVAKLSRQKQEELIEKNKNIISNMIDASIEARKVYQDDYGVLFEKAVDYSLNYKNSLFEIEDYIASLYYKTNNNELKNLINNYFKLKRKLNESYLNNISNLNIKKLNEQIKVVYNQILFLKPYKNKFVTKKDIINSLKDGELFINIVYSNKKYYIFYFDNQGNYGWNILNEKRSKNLNSNIKKYRDLIKKLKINSYNISLIKQKNKVTNLIYLDLFGFIVNDKNMPLRKYKKIIVSSDGLLRLVSFGELYNSKNKKYLIEEKEIAYIPSAKFLLNKPQKQKVKNAIIFADPEFNSNVKSKVRGNSILTIEDLYRGIKFTSLSGTLREATSLQTILSEYKISKKVYLKKQANVDNLLSVNSPSILHIATHGFFINSDKILNPMLKSGIALTGANKTKDGIVTALKISGLDLGDTDLVVLSACDTGVVDLRSTDNVSALNKSFLLAGAKSVVATLWEINDKETVEFMKLFYKEYLKTKNASKALRNAKMKFIKEYKSSVYWAPFVCFER